MQKISQSGRKGEAVGPAGRTQTSDRIPEAAVAKGHCATEGITDHKKSERYLFTRKRYKLSNSHRSFHTAVYS